MNDEGSKICIRKVKIKKIFFSKVNVVRNAEYKLFHFETLLNYFIQNTFQCNILKRFDFNVILDNFFPSHYRNGISKVINRAKGTGQNVIPL